MPEPRCKPSNNEKVQIASGPLRAQRGRDLHLPLILTDDKDIEALCPLIHAGQAEAAMQVVFDPRGGGPQPGLVVTDITPSGWMVLLAALGESEGEA